jgi:hypothetical protein
LSRFHAAASQTIWRNHEILYLAVVGVFGCDCSCCWKGCQESITDFRNRGRTETPKKMIIEMPTKKAIAPHTEPNERTTHEWNTMIIRMKNILRQRK